MDGRGALKLSLFLLMAGGCQHQVMTVPNPGDLSSANKPSLLDASQIKPASTKAKALPPQVWVSCGDFKAGEASAADVPPDRRQHIRDLARADYEQALEDQSEIRAGLPGIGPSVHGHARHAAGHRHLSESPENRSAGSLLFGTSWACATIPQKNYGPALDCLKQAAQIDPGNRSCVNAMGVVLAETGHYDESLKCFSRSGGEALGYYRLARTLQRLQRPELSQRYLEVALEKDPSLAATLAQSNRDPAPLPSAPPPVQQTAYQVPNVAPAPSAPAVPPVQQTAYQIPNVAPAPSAPAAPTETPLDASGAEYPPPEQIILPPPPAVNVQYEQPNP